MKVDLEGVGCGLVIVAVCIGVMTEAVYGWLTFGGGTIVAAFLAPYNVKRRLTPGT